MNDFEDQLADLTMDQIEELRRHALRRREATDEKKKQDRMTDPAGTVRYLKTGSTEMFLVRIDDPDEDGPYWDPYLAERHGIPIEDGSFNPDEAPVVGRIQ